MYATERTNEILKLLSDGTIKTVPYLSKTLYISESTIRRNLAELEKKGLVIRTHGGVMALNLHIADHTPSFFREAKNIDKKEKIAKIAITHIKDGDTIMLDDTTTTLCLLPFLKDFQKITVVTNGIKAAYSLCEQGISTILLGGSVISNNFSVVGAETMNMLNNLYADVAFFSCRYLSDNGIASDNSIEETYVRRAMMMHAQKKILLVDSTKLHNLGRHVLCRTDEIDECICDEPLPWESE